MYAGRLYSKYVSEHNCNLYGSKLITLPIPKLVTFYNGKLDKNDMVLELKDAFQIENEQIKAEPDIAVRVHMLNINYGRNKELMAACQPLAEYAWLVEQIRINSENMEIKPAVTKVLDDMLDKYIIKNLLINNRAEVTQMCITEYDEAKTMEQFKAEGREEGIAEGIEKGMAKGIEKGRAEGRKEGRAEGRVEGRAEGKAEGKSEGKLEALLNIIKSLDLSLDKAMDAIGIAANEKEKYAVLVKSAMQP